MKSREELIEEIQGLQQVLMNRFIDRVHGAVQGFMMGECFQDRCPLNTKPTDEQLTVGWAVNTDVLCAFIEQMYSERKLGVDTMATVMQQYKEELPADSPILSSIYLEDPLQVSQMREDQKQSPISFPDFVLARVIIAGFWNYQSMDEVIRNAERICRLTHASKDVVGSCVVVAYLLRKILIDEPFMRDELIWLSRNYSEKIGDYVKYAYENNMHFLKPNTSEGEATTILKTMGLTIWALIQKQDFFETYSFLARELRFFRPCQAVVIALLGAKVGLEGIPANVGEAQGYMTAYRGSSLAYQAKGAEQLCGYLMGRAYSLVDMLKDDLKNRESYIIIP